MFRTLAMPPRAPCSALRTPSHPHATHNVCANATHHRVPAARVAEAVVDVAEAVVVVAKAKTDVALAKYVAAQAKVDALIEKQKAGEAVTEAEIAIAQNNLQMVKDTYTRADNACHAARTRLQTLTEAATRPVASRTYFVTRKQVRPLHLSFVPPIVVVLCTNSRRDRLNSYSSVANRENTDNV